MKKKQKKNPPTQLICTRVHNQERYKKNCFGSRDEEKRISMQ